MRHLAFRLFALLAVSLFVSPFQSFACGKIDGLVDFNGDGEVVVVVLGDSIPYGFGDAAGKGGYPGRVATKLRAVTFINLAELGLKSQQHILKIERAFDSGSEGKLRSALLKADYVVQDLGRNNRWDFGLPSATYRDLQRAAKLIRSRVTGEGRVPPLVITAVMMLPNRGSQGPWVKELNTLILKSSKYTAPADLRFDLVSKRLLSTDQIHPTPQGYDALASTFAGYLKKTLAKHVAKLRTDKDGDGLFDEIESAVYGTDPKVGDTDGDGVLDGVEVCKAGTDPLAGE